MNDFRDKAISGILWSVTGQAGRQGLILIIGIILQRLLSPEAFGLIAMVTVITNFANVFAEFGFGAAIVHKQDVREVHLSSVFWLNLGIGLLLTVLFLAGAPLVAGFYQEPLLVPLTMLVAMNFFISSLNIVQKTLFMKRLDFRKLSVVEILSVGLSGTVAILLALRGFGVWSLAVQSVLLSAATAVLLWKLSDWRPSLTFDWPAVKELLGFSSNLFGSHVLNYWVRNVDYLLIGRFLGDGPLGIYNRSYAMMLFPLRNISRVVSRVMFPSFSTIQEDRERVKRVFLRMTRTIALITFPMMLGLFVTVESFVLAILGPQWAGMIPVLQILSTVGMIQSIGTLNGNLYLSQGRADLQFRVGLVLKLIVIAGIAVGLKWGVVGVAAGYAIASLLISYPSFFFAGRLVDLTYVELVKNLAPVFGSAALMALLVWGLGLLLPAGLPHWAVLAAKASCGVAVYGGLIHLLDLEAYRDIKRIIREQLGRRRQIEQAGAGS